MLVPEGLTLVAGGAVFAAGANDAAAATVGCADCTMVITGAG
jgi:hypothetical protein